MEELFNIIVRVFGLPRTKDFDEAQISVDCPNCDEGAHKGNLEINLEKDIYSCWACRETSEGVTGRGVKWLIRKYGDNQDFKEYSTLVPSVKIATIQKVAEEVILPKEYKNFSRKNEHSPGYKEALEYLITRGLNMNILEKFHIGFCNDGKYGKRIIIPSFDLYGNINYFLGRDWTGKNKIPYLNHDNPKQDLIFNEYFVNWDLSVILTEGSFDHLVTFNSVAILGKTLSPKFVSVAQNNLKGNLYIAFDGDALKTAKELQKQLDFGKLRGRVYVIELPLEEDPSSLYKKLGEKGLHMALSEGVLRF